MFCKGWPNNHPTTPTFIQLLKILSVYFVLKPPKYGNFTENISNVAKIINVLLSLISVLELYFFNYVILIIANFNFF